MPLVGWRTEGIFAHQSARGGNLVREIVILRWIYTIDAVTKKSDRFAIGIQCTSMCGSVDSLRKATNDRVTTT